MSYSIIVPAYNEENGIELVLCQLSAICNQSGDLFEIIVVNDGSTDKTKEKIESLNLPFILLNKFLNQGYGAALKTGIENAKYDFIVITDADGTYPNERIPELTEIALKGNYDMVVGARVGQNVKIPVIRRPAKWFITKLASYLTERKIPDLNSGLRVMKKAAVKKFFNILPNGFSFTTTISLSMLTNGLTVKYVPIDYHRRQGKSKIKPFKDTLNFIQLIIRTILYFNPLRVFVPFAFLLGIFSLIVLAGSWFFMDRVMDVTFGIILMTAVMVLSIGMLADLIDKRMK